MTTSYEDFVSALEYLVAIEPDPKAYDDDMDEYDRIMAPFEANIDKAHATIRAYGQQIAPQGLEHMQGVLQQLLAQQTDQKSISIMRSKVNWHWDGCGEWLW